MTTLTKTDQVLKNAAIIYALAAYKSGSMTLEESKNYINQNI